VPKEVITAFEKAYSHAKGMKFEEETFEGKAAYEVEYKENDKEIELELDVNGNILKIENE
jgi:uncharacterized membrane protein YkoI